ncbi:LON peptidase substrate-binding domain-containing protein [Actinomadura scrupuli]|uniref:LON peptidase substrate-binding domain-containing protein n=1 Tax=Actinomadura scrupuli TaxID=559629 RepID=UPI003D9578B8
MNEQLPLFPLGTVLFPGLVLPLHVFEERYRLLIRDLLQRPEPHRFGIVSIEPGQVAGDEGALEGRPEPGPGLAMVGCTAEVHGVIPHADGRFDVVTVGGRRFDVTGMDDSLPYLRADVEFRPDCAGPDPGPAARRVTRLFRLYRGRLAEAGAEVRRPVELPPDPVRLSYLVAAAVVLDRAEKQRLLEAEDATARFRLEEEFLLRETRLLDALPAVPASPFLDDVINPN